jgi:hypothetical protein
MPNRPMKGYARRHEFRGGFYLQMEDTTRDSTILPLLAHDQGMTNPEDVHVNPVNDSYTGVSDSHECYGGSVINKLYLQLIVQSYATDMITRTMLIHGSFDDWDVKNEQDADKTIAQYLRVKSEATNENQIHPDWSGVDLANASSLGASVAGLTGGQTIESVAFDADDFEEKYSHSVVSGMLRKVTSGIRTGVIYEDRPYIERRWFDVPSNVKRINRNTFMGLLLDLPQASSHEQMYLGGDVTDPPLYVSFKVKFNEWNDMFNQDP